ncbi:MAG: hypothetical protein LUH54_03115 [Firmicutes bacterium]|nr:hypothetical protein [Bacillota bacterium]
MRDEKDDGGIYADIINLPHKQSAWRARMTMSGRAAQFAPFAALTGYDDAVKASDFLDGEEEKKIKKDIDESG